MGPNPVAHGKAQNVVIACLQIRQNSDGRSRRCGDHDLSRHRARREACGAVSWHRACHPAHRFGHTAAVAADHAQVPSRACP